MSFNIGENIGPYRIMEQLGQGGMATVYKAYHASLDRYVALKVLHPAFNQDQTFTLRFQREARVVARLEHQNIVPVYDYAEHEGRPYLVMKYIEGDTLKARLNQGPLNSQEIEQVVNSVGYALAYAHRQGILHRDIKPSNVMIAKDGTMYLADFGLARIAEAGESTLSSDAIMGTPQYISPEQAMGKKDLDAGTDIYSFGVMLYEMVVGRVPFTSDTPFSIIHDHIYTPLPLPRSVNSNVPEQVERVLLKSLAKDRADRYASIEDLIKAFKDAWTEAGVPMQGTAIIMRSTALKKENQPAPAVPTEEKKPKKKLSPWAWVGIGGVVLLCCLFALTALRNMSQNRQADSAAPSEVAPQVQPQQLDGQNVPTPQNPAPGEVPPPQPVNDSLEVQAAREAVQKNPQDPQAHLTLSLALWDAKQIPPAIDEMIKAADLAPKDSPDFFLSAADQYKQRGAWSFASAMYLRALPSYRGKPIPEDVQVNMREAIYKASEQVSEKDLKFFDQLENSKLNAPIAHIARARHALFAGNLEEANAELDKARKAKPDMYEIALLEGEIAFKQGDAQKAKDLFASLAAKPEVPEWIRAMAEEYLKTLQ
ncbi:MAG: hypothetical protein Fur002_25360 [Anaerolineales bacterium]